MSNLKFEVGKHYRTRDGHKAMVLLIRPYYMVGEVDVGEVDGYAGPFIWMLDGGSYSEAIPCNSDLVAEWREPARLWVMLVRHRATGAVRVFEQKDLSVSWHELYEVLGRFELVEGEGLKS